MAPAPLTPRVPPKGGSALTLPWHRVTRQEDREGDPVTPNVPWTPPHRHWGGPGDPGPALSPVYPPPCAGSAAPPAPLRPNVPTPHCALHTTCFVHPSLCPTQVPLCPWPLVMPHMGPTASLAVPHRGPIESLSPCRAPHGSHCLPGPFTAPYTSPRMSSDPHCAPQRCHCVLGPLLCPTRVPLCPWPLAVPHTCLTALLAPCCILHGSHCVPIPLLCPRWVPLHPSPLLTLRVPHCIPIPSLCPRQVPLLPQPLAVPYGTPLHPRPLAVP